MVGIIDDEELVLKMLTFEWFTIDFGKYKDFNVNIYNEIYDFILSNCQFAAFYSDKCKNFYSVKYKNLHYFMIYTHQYIYDSLIKHINLIIKEHNEIQYGLFYYNNKLFLSHFNI